MKRVLFVLVLSLTLVACSSSEEIETAANSFISDTYGKPQEGTPVERFEVDSQVLKEEGGQATVFSAMCIDRGGDDIAYSGPMLGIFIKEGDKWIVSRLPEPIIGERSLKEFSVSAEDINKADEDLIMPDWCRQQ